MILNPKIYTLDGKVFNTVYYSTGDVVVGDLICFKRFDLRINNEDVVNIRDVVLDYYGKYKYEEGFNFLMNRAPAGCITTYTFRPTITQKILDVLNYYTNETNPVKVFNSLKNNSKLQIKIGDNLGNHIITIQYQSPNNYNNNIENIAFYFVEKKLYMNFRLVDFIELLHQLKSFSNYYYNIAPYNKTLDISKLENVIDDKLNKFKDEIIQSILSNNRINEISKSDITITTISKEENVINNNDNNTSINTADERVFEATKEIENFIDNKINNTDNKEENSSNFFRISRHTYYDYMTILSIIKANKLDKKFLYNIPIDIDREQKYYSEKYKEYKFTELIIAARIIRNNLSSFNTNNILYLFYRYITETKLSYIIPYVYYLYSLENSTIQSNFQNKRKFILSIRNTIVSDSFKNFITKQELGDKLNNIQEYFENDFKLKFNQLFKEFLEYMKDLFGENLHKFIEKGIIENQLPIEFNIDSTYKFDINDLFKHLNINDYKSILKVSKEEGSQEFEFLSLMQPNTYYMLLSNNLNVFAARVIEEIINNNKELGDIDPYDLYQQLTKTYNKQLEFEQIQYFFNNKDLYTSEILQSLYNIYKTTLEKIITNNLDEDKYIKKSILDANNIQYQKLFNINNHQTINQNTIQSLYEQFINTNINDKNIKEILLKYKPTSGDTILSLFILLYPYINNEFITLYTKLIQFLQENNIPLTYNPDALLKVLVQLKSVINNLNDELSNKSISKDALQILLSSDLYKKTGNIYLLDKNMTKLLYELSDILSSSSI